MQRSTIVSNATAFPLTYEQVIDYLRAQPPEREFDGSHPNT
jgi:hypothetical protein